MHINTQKYLFLKKNKNKQKHFSLWSLIQRGIPTTVQVCKAIKCGPLSTQIRANRVREPIVF